jgi:hypothetical protein
VWALRKEISMQNPKETEARIEKPQDRKGEKHGLLNLQGCSRSSIKKFWKRKF